MDTLEFIHIENLQNQVQYGTIDASWWSAMWEFEPVIVTSNSKLELENAASIYPNPTRGDFNLSISNFAPGENISIAIFNITGQLVFSSSCAVNINGVKDIEINTGDSLQPGNYFIVAQGNSTIAKAKLIICR